MPRKDKPNNANDPNDPTEGKNNGLGPDDFERTGPRKGRRKLRKSKKHGTVSVRRKRRGGRGRTKTGLPVDQTDNEIKAIKELYHTARLATKTTGVLHKVVHLVPLADGGRHEISNLDIVTEEDSFVSSPLNKDHRDPSKVVLKPEGYVEPQEVMTYTLKVPHHLDTETVDPNHVPVFTPELYIP